MYLKTLTLRGFKSFASATSLRFEPGITCVVGPNGSGKSNVVDAFSWVMGEQGVKPLRGGKMEDVVFAGTAGRPALGRAEVTLTIDNSDGALPIDYAEVTISRLLFRSGQSEYAINGDHCRLLDVQELLSDSGLGREMHVIVGQGQLDAVLNSGPEARRALIEEAAGVLKHRSRKEKALRKLDAMQANLTRLVDLTGELGRRLKPLGRQAEIARRAAVIQADLRDARLRLLADDYADAGRRAGAGTRSTRPPGWRAGPPWTAPGAGPRSARPSWTPPSSSTRRARRGPGDVVRAVRAGRAAARHAGPGPRAAPPPVAAPEPQRPGRDPDELDREAASCASRKTALRPRLAAAREHLTARGQRAHRGRGGADRRSSGSSPGRQSGRGYRADRLARLRGQVGAAASRQAAAAPGRGGAAGRGLGRRGPGPGRAGPA